MNFSEAMFYENYLTSDFHTNTAISRRVCLLVKMASKSVIRPIGVFRYYNVTCRLMFKERGIHASFLEGSLVNVAIFPPIFQSSHIPPKL